MTYVRWIRRKSGKFTGPYIYKSVRVGKTVVGKYIRKANSIEVKKQKQNRRFENAKQKN
jgi:hypothetical protein